MVDPRVTPAEVARRVGLSRTAVQARLSSWKQSGFHQGHEVWPNPRLFGARMFSVDISVANPTEADRMFEDLALVEGVISARDLMNESGRIVRAYVADDGTVNLERRREWLRRVIGLPNGPELRPYWIPEPAPRLSKMDWRILSFFRTDPESNLSEAAANLGISAKTLSSRRDRLLDGQAMWWLLNTRNSRFPVVSLHVDLTDASDRGRLLRTFDTILPGWVPCAREGIGIAPIVQNLTISGLALVDSPAAIDDIVRNISRQPGVSSVHWYIPRNFRSYDEWFDRHLLGRLAGSLSGFDDHLRSRPYPTRSSEADSEGGGPERRLVNAFPAAVSGSSVPSVPSASSVVVGGPSAGARRTRHNASTVPSL